MIKVGLLVGAAVAIGATCGLVYMNKKLKEKEETLYDELVKECNKVKLKVKDANVMGKVSAIVNEGVGKLKAVTDAWEAKENGIAKANVPKTDFEMACEEDTIAKDLDEEVGKKEEGKSERVEDKFGLWEELDEDISGEIEESIEDLAKEIEEEIKASENEDD